jgi:hypothetical protein
MVARKLRSVAGVARRNCDGTAVWIEQNFGGVEPQAACQIVGAVYAIPVKLTRSKSRHEGMPVMIGSILYGKDERWPDVIIPVEEEQIDRRGIAGIDAEIHASGNDARPKRGASSDGGVR